jgi:hypothetical protein
MAVTYSFTDAEGVEHTRTSRRHLAPVYPFATVGYAVIYEVPRAFVCFHSRRELAETRVRTWHGPKCTLHEVAARVHGKKEG